jgi:multidrug efflux pump subunit AcrB
MWLIRLSVRNPYVVAAFAFVLAILGILSLTRIPVDILPVFKSPAVQVLTYYPGMPASSIEKTITNRIERWVNQAPGARLMESRSVPGVSVVKVYFRDDIDPTARALRLILMTERLPALCEWNPRTGKTFVANYAPMRKSWSAIKVSWMTASACRPLCSKRRQ